MIQSDTIRQAIRKKMTLNTTLKTTGGAEFFVETLTPNEIVFRVGEKKSRVVLHLNAIDDLVKEFKFFPPGRWMRIGSTPIEPKPGTLESVVRPHTQGGSSASHFAAVLQHVKVAEIDSKRPAKLRLTV